MKLKQRTCFLWIVFTLAVLLFAACSTNVEHTPTNTPIPVETLATTEPETETAAPITEPVTELTCLSLPETSASLLPAQNGAVLVSWQDFEASTTQFRIVDPVSNTVTAELDIDGYVDLFPETFTDGSFVLRDGANEQWIFLSPTLEQQSVFPSEYLDGFFSHDRTRFYYLKDRLLYVADTQTGESSAVSLPGDLRFAQIQGLHSTENIISLSFYLSPYGTDCGTAILDLDSGSFSMLQETPYFVTFGADTTSFLYFDIDTMQYEVTCCKESTVLHIESPEAADTWGPLAVKGADYLLGYDETATLYHLSETVTACNLEAYGIPGVLQDACWVAKHGLLVGGVWDETGTKLFAVCPALLDFSKAVSTEAADTPIAVEEAYLSASQPASVEEYLQSLREEADRIEQTYGVTVAFSGQAAQLAEECPYELVNTDTLEEETEAGELAFFLNALDESLSMYPEGFFRQFQNSAGDGGLCFLPVAEIISDNSVVGVCYSSGIWSPIAIKAQMDGLVGSLCHEIWHATEDKIVYNDYTLLLEDTWSQWNPEGFQYNEDADNLTDAPYRWTLFDDTDGVYFIDDYARTNSKEDRARLMEYVMAQSFYHEQIQASPALMAKLQCMCDAVRQCFDTDGWTEVAWEQLLP